MVSPLPFHAVFLKDCTIKVNMAQTRFKLTLNRTSNGGMFCCWGRGDIKNEGEYLFILGN